MKKQEAPIILAGTTDSGTRYVQFWTEKEKIAGREVAFCRAEMNDGDAYAPALLSIKHGCPDGWVDLAIGVFEVFRAGADVEPTHTVAWVFGVPTFTPVEGGAA